MEQEDTWMLAAEEVIGFPLKEKQREVIDALLNNQHVFAILPTGYGKSVCFGTFPAAYKKVMNSHVGIVNGMF